jgi:hypothetical protein
MLQLGLLGGIEVGCRRARLVGGQLDKARGGGQARCQTGELRGYGEDPVSAVANLLLGRERPGASDVSLGGAGGEGGEAGFDAVPAFEDLRDGGGRRSTKDEEAAP